MYGFILTPTYRIARGTPEVHLYGVLESGEPCLVIDDRTRPHFFVLQRDAARIATLTPGLKVEPSTLRSLDGETVATITVGVPGDVPPLRRKLEEGGVACLEADVRFAYRYLIDRGIRGAFEVDGPYGTKPRLGRVYRNPTLRPAHWTPALKILSIDIETSFTGEQLYSIALHTRDFDRVIIVHEHMLEHAEPVHSEKAAIRRFLEYLHALDPDVITGWNVVDFDLAFLARAARRHGLHFAIGRNDDEFALQKDASFTRESRASVFGRQVLDGLSLMRGAFIRLDDYKLETAAQAFLGKGKLISGDHRHTEIEALYRRDPQRLVDYNLQDARLVLELLDRTGLIELAVERSLLTGMQLDRVSAAIASVDSLYLNALRQRGVVAPSVGSEEREARIAGGYVMDSKPGLYQNVLVFDFKSLYPSIIRTFNIDPLTHVRQQTSDVETVRAPNGAHFRRDVPGIIPALLTQLAAEREQAKRAGQTVKANAIKILMNSFYGVLGAGASRLFSPDVANAVTSFGQHLIRYAGDFAASKGHEVLYGDTDSLFVYPNEPDAERARLLGERLRAEIGAAVAQRVQTEFGCESVLELEFEKLYRRFFLPEVRGGKVGSKKRYAGLVVEGGREDIEFVGLESVRRDWSAVSKRFQRELMQRVFHDQPVEDFIRGFIADLRAGKFDDQLTYKKAVRKDIDAYTKTTPPHVKAARKQGTMTGRIIAYVLTLNGPEPVSDLTAPPDYPHYIEHQIAPIADAVLHFLGSDFDAIMQTKKQLALF
ncbi:MAG TPA: DNA polymerase II [Candidatus Margulisiibacteriota bacterium]|nr:DNA polymerase II [Candidatus Margulisiibacteriota bacterium]